MLSFLPALMRINVFLYVTAIIIAVGFGKAKADSEYTSISDGIKAKYDSLLFTLDPGTQRHYAVRMYRLSGDETYLYPIIFYSFVTTNELRNDLDSMADASYVKRRSDQLLDYFNEKTRKGDLRHEYFKDHRVDLFYLRLAYLASQLRECGLDKDVYKFDYGRSVAAMKEHDYHSLLTDTSLIRIFAAQMVNFVYYLYEFHIVDLRAEYRTAFQTVFPDSLDGVLSDREFGDKVYGLTHFILAASEFYQHEVKEEEFSWILEYFQSNQERILYNLKADIIAEVGISYLLADESNHELVHLCRQVIASRFDEKHNMIPSRGGHTDPAKGEHRNILAYMLFNWSGHLHPGPNLPKYKEFQKLLP